MVMTLALGFALGFMGYLPPGNINMAVVQLALKGEQTRLRLFLVFASIMEFLYCFGCLWSLGLLMRQPHLVLVMQWTAVFVFALLGVLSFFHDENPAKIQVLSGFGRGLFAIIINPLQIPFWLVWGVYLSDRLNGDFFTVIIFALVTSLGTATLLWLYAVGGKKMIELLKLERRLIDRAIGVVLMALAVWQLFKILHKH